MDACTVWKDFFRNWPDNLPREAVVVTTMGEQIPLAGFLTSEKLLLVHRRTPDTVGSRQVLIPYQNIDSVKITSVVKPKVFTAAGFEGTLPKAT